jgi:ERCC4-type nuclease
MIVIIDSREQMPYEFRLPTEVAGLKTGDYSVKGLESWVAVERKTVADLVACLTTGRDRFENELHRGRGLDYFALVVEASLVDLATGKYRSQMLPKAVIQSLMTFSVRYRLPVFFAENRVYGERITESLLQKYYREMEKKIEAVEKRRR